MQDMIRIAKINACALLALPLLGVSLLAQLLKKALEKTMVFLGVGTALLALSILHSVFNRPGGIFEVLGTAFVLLVFFSAIIISVVMALVFFGGVAAVFITAVVTALMGLLDAVFRLCHHGYSRLYDLCKTEYQHIVSEEKGGALKAGCAVWHLLTGLNKAVVVLLSAAFPISILAGVGFAGCAVFSVHHVVSENFGIGVLRYLQLFSGVEVVFTVLYFVVVVLSVEAVIVSLGIEWSEWGQTLKLSTQDYQSYRASIEQSAQRFTSAAEQMHDPFAAGQSTQRCQQSMETLRELFANMEHLRQQVDAAIYVGRDSYLLYEFAAYTEMLSQILEQMEQFKSGIPCHIFEQRLIPLIDAAKKKEYELEKVVFSVLNRHITQAGKQQEQFDFFAGCESAEAVRKRYRSLCKVYHPDVGGHEETFKQLQAQYELRIAAADVSTGADNDKAASGAQPV